MIRTRRPRSKPIEGSTGRRFMTGRSAGLPFLLRANDVIE
jgi:hypothetical protein